MIASILATVAGLALIEQLSAAVSYVASATATATSGNLIIDKPIGTADTDVLIAHIGVDGGTGISVTPPGGWTLIRRTDNGTSIALASYYLVAGGSEPANYTFTISGSTARTGAISTYAGVDNASPIDASSGQTGSGTSVTAASVTTASNDEMLVGLYSLLNNGTWTPPSGMAERYDFAQSGSSKIKSEGADALQASAGASGAKSATSSKSGAWSAQLIALNVAIVAYSFTDVVSAIESVAVGIPSSDVSSVIESIATAIGGQTSDVSPVTESAMQSIGLANWDLIALLESVDRLRGREETDSEVIVESV
ncbi:MAG: hypothetical protein IID58_14160, partial [Proteobacteria bacterium]|nr:hypothetical protein [Pseudomonadota bacterium]